MALRIRAAWRVIEGMIVADHLFACDDAHVHQWPGDEEYESLLRFCCSKYQSVNRGNVFIAWTKLEFKLKQTTERKGKKRKERRNIR